MSALAAPERLAALALLLPFVGAAILAMAGRWPNLREAVTLVTAVSLCLAVAGLVEPVLAGTRPLFNFIEVLPGLSIALKVEPLGMLFALVASALWIVNSIYSIGYMRANDEPRQTTFYVCFAVALGSTMGVAFAENLFTLFLFYEVLTISTYPLVTHRADAEAIRAGRLYLILLLGSSLLLFLPAIVATWLIAGTVTFTPGGILAGKVGPWGIGLLLVLYVFGIGKAAVMPMHRWLPAAMVAPTPVSALLHAVAVVKAGVFSILKIAVLIFGIDVIAAAGLSLWLTALAGFTIIAASIVALRQDNLKRRLAYSTVSQLSYIVLGVAILTPVAAIGAAMHIAAHAVSKITLFFAAGSIYTATHLTEISQLDGIGRRMPWTMGAFAVGALSLIGIPPASGFVSKWFIMSGAADDGQVLVLLLLVASTLLNAAYFLPIVHAAFFRKPDADSEAHPHGEAPWPMVLALMMTAVMTVALFFCSDLLLELVTPLTGSPLLTHRIEAT